MSLEGIIGDAVVAGAVPKDDDRKTVVTGKIPTLYSD